MADDGASSTIPEIVEHQLGAGYVRHLAVDAAWCGLCHPSLYQPKEEVTT